MSPRGFGSAFGLSRALRRSRTGNSFRRPTSASRRMPLAAETLESRAMLATTATLSGDLSGFTQIPVTFLRPDGSVGFSRTAYVGQLGWSAMTGDAAAAGVPAAFKSFCIEGLQSVAPGTNSFAEVRPLAASSLLGATRSGLLADFWRQYGPADAAGFADKTDSAAFQLAVWEIINDGRPAAGQAATALAGGTFKVAGTHLTAPAVARAAAWLNGTGTATVGGGAVALYALQSPTRQDQVVCVPLPNITVQVSPANVAEDGPQKLTYTFTASAASATPIVVNYAISGTATAANDFTGLPAGASTGAITIPANSSAPGSAATLTITPTPDTVIEFDETVVISLLPGTGYTFDTTRPPATGTIENDDYLLDLILDGLPEETAPEPNEISPGSILPIGGGRTRLDLIVASPGYAGTVTLFVTTGADGVDAVTLRDAEEDGTQVLPTTWQVGQHPRTLWVETTGVEADIQLVAMFQNRGQTKEDAVKAIATARPDIEFDARQITAAVKSWMNGGTNRLEDNSFDMLTLAFPNAIVVDEALGTFRSIHVKAQAIDDPAISRENREDFYFQGKQTTSAWSIFRGVDHNPGFPYAWLRDDHPGEGVSTPADFENLPDVKEKYWEAEFKKWSQPRITAQRMTGTLDVTYVYAGKLDPATTWISKRSDFRLAAGDLTPPGHEYPYPRPLNVDSTKWMQNIPHHADKPAGWDLTSTLTLHFEFRSDLENEVRTVVGTWAIDDIHGKSDGRINVDVSIAAP